MFCLKENYSEFPHNALFLIKSGHSLTIQFIHGGSRLHNSHATDMWKGLEQADLHMQSSGSSSAH